MIKHADTLTGKTCENALYIAAKSGNLLAIQILCDFQAIKSHGGLQPITSIGDFNFAMVLAAKYGHLDVVKRLADSGVDVRTDDDVPLRAACAAGEIDVARYLLDCAADPNKAMESAASSSNPGCIKLLISHGAIVTTDILNRLLASACHSGNLQVAEFLLKAGAKPDRNALEIACLGGKIEVVKLLAKHGADLRADDDKLLNEACIHYRFDLVEYLVGAGITNSRAIERARRCKQWDILEILLEI